MRVLASVGCLTVICASLGCARLEFEGGGGLVYYEPKPYLFVASTKECVTTATVIVLPGARKTLRLVSGYGSSDLSASLSNGMLTSVGQKTDTKIPESISAVANLAAKAVAPGGGGPCTVANTLYPIVDGEPDLNKPLIIPTPPK